MQKPLDHIREGTLYKISEYKQQSLGSAVRDDDDDDVDTEEMVVKVSLPIVLEHQLHFAIAHCAKLKKRRGSECRQMLHT